MKIIKSEVLSTGLALRIYSSTSIMPNEYIGEKWIIPAKDGEYGFIIIDRDPSQTPNLNNRKWLAEFISITLQGKEDDVYDTAIDYLKWHFRVLIESALYRYHIAVNESMYSEILLYQEINNLIDKIIDAGIDKMKEEKPEDPTPESR